MIFRVCSVGLEPLLWRPRRGVSQLHPWAPVLPVWPPGGSQTPHSAAADSAVWGSSCTSTRPGYTTHSNQLTEPLRNSIVFYSPFQMTAFYLMMGGGGRGLQIWTSFCVESCFSKYTAIKKIFPNYIHSPKSHTRQRAAHWTWHDG